MPSRLKIVTVALIFIVGFIVLAIAYSGSFTGEGTLTQNILNVPAGTPTKCLVGRDYMTTIFGPIDLNTKPPKPGCPGYDPALNTQIGTFELGSVRMRLPREYLWQERFAKDGPVNGLYMLMLYPAMSPGSIKGPQEHNVKVTLKWIRPRVDGSIAKKPQEIYISRYKSLISGVPLSEVAITNVQNLNMLNFPLEYNFKGKKVTEREIFFRGDIELPDYWLDCGIKQKKYQRPRCNALFILSNKIIVEYSFSREMLLSHHDQIRISLEQKLSSFIQSD